MSGSWMKGVVGLPSTQYTNALEMGQDNNKYTGNMILPLNYKGLRGGKKKRGGSLAGILATAATPGTLLLLQNQIKGKKHSRRRSRRGRKFTRRYRR